MADLTELLNDLKRLDNLSEKDNATRRKNSFEAVNAFLRKLLNKNALTIIDDAITNSRSQKARNLAMPTYNVRTPVVYIWINGVMVFPFNDDIGDVSKYSGIYFENFDVSYPIGGVETIVNANLKLFAKDPGLVIEAIEGTKYQKNFSTTNTSGLPLVTMQWGWRFGQPEGEHDTKEVLSPAINFIVTEVIMENPESTGTFFTFKLQDIGNCVLGMSRKSVAVDPMPPQDQIRYLIEGLLNFRLFTLDDLLNLSGNRGNRTVANTSLETNEEARTFFVNKSLGPIATNSYNYLTICEKLAYQCKCRWTSIKVGDIESQAEESAEAKTEITALESSLNDLIKTQISDDEEDAAKKKETLAGEIKKTEQALGDANARLALSCKLYWFDNVPAEFRTLGSEKYIKDEETRKETGAFFLLPDIEQSDGDFSTPLCFGPGASSFPYLHGSASNVFNASIQDSHSQTFGDVLSMTTKYDNMVALLKASVTENAMSITDTDYMRFKERGMAAFLEYQQRLSNKKTSKSTTNKTLIDKELTNQENAKIDSSLSNIRTGVRNNARTNFRFINPTSPTGITIGDADIGKPAGSLSNTPVQAIDKQYYNVSDVKDYASMGLRNRTNFFLKYPVSVNMTVFGDPTLIRMGIGGFELLSYYPSDDGKTQKLNSFLSGVYHPLTITHRLSAGNYTCDISGIKLTSMNKYSVTSQILTKTIQEELSAKDKDDKQMSSSLKEQAIQVQLDSDEFTSGFLASSLRDLYRQSKGL